MNQKPNALFSNWKRELKQISNSHKPQHTRTPPKW